MAQNYFSIVTNIGRNKLALSAAGGAAVTITHFAIGDGNGAEVNPTAASTALVREVWRTPVESVVIDPLNHSAVLVTSIIPTTAGGWWMREFGIFDVEGDMIAVAKPVSQYKPTALEGQLEDIRYEFQIIIGETANVTMLVDPSVLLASRAWVEGRKVPVAQLSLTPWLPVKSISVTAPPANPASWDTYVIPAGATGVWAGHAQKLAEWNGKAWNIVIPPDGHGISLPDGRVFVRLGGLYTELVATETRKGLVELATKAEVSAGVDETRAVTPAGLLPLVPTGARQTKAFTPNIAIPDIANPVQDYIAQSLTVTGTRYIDAFGVMAFRNQNAGTVPASAIMWIRLTGGALEEFIGCAVPGYAAQTPVSSRRILQGLDPTITYTVQMVVQKLNSIGPLEAMDPLLVVYTE